MSPSLKPLREIWVSNKLPETHRNEIINSIGSMKVGQVGYALSWALRVNSSWSCYLVPSYPVSKEPFGTTNMKIERKQDGYHVWVNDSYNGKDTITPEFISVREVHVPEKNDGTNRDQTEINFNSGLPATLKRVTPGSESGTSKDIVEAEILREGRVGP